jgi:hypothetical protein
MDRGYFTIIGLLVVGVAYGLLKKQRPAGKKSNSGWIGLLVLCVPLGGLYVADRMRDESLSWFFGLSLMFGLPILFFFAVGSAVGGWFKGGKDEKK